MSKSKTMTTDMTKGKPLKLILLFALTVLGGNVCQQLYTVVDTAVLGKGIGMDALSSVGAVEWLIWMMTGLAIGFTEGFSIRMSQRFGAGDLKGLRQTIGQSAVMSVLLMALITLLSQLFALPMVRFLNTPAGLQSGSLLYLRIIFGGLPLYMTYNLLAGILRAMGDGRTPLIAIVTATFTNIALDLLFVIGFGWGIAGAAAATLIGQGISIIVCALKLKTMKEIRLEKDDLRIRPALCGKLMLLGLPMAFQNLIIAVGGVTVQSVVNDCGEIFIAGFTATNKLYGLLEIAATSYGYAMVTYVGQNLGAGRGDRLKRGLRDMLGVSIGTAVLIGSLMVILGQEILKLFLDVNQTGADEALRIGYRYLCVMSIPLPVLYLLYIFRSFIQGVGNTWVPMLSGVSELVMRTGAAFLLPVLFGKENIVFAEPLAWIGADVVLITAFLIMRRRVFAIDKAPESAAGADGAS